MNALIRGLLVRIAADLVNGRGDDKTVADARSLASQMPDLEMARMVIEAPTTKDINMIALTPRGRRALQDAIDAGAE